MKRNGIKVFSIILAALIALFAGNIFGYVASQKEWFKDTEQNPITTEEATGGLVVEPEANAPIRFHVEKLAETTEEGISAQASSYSITATITPSNALNQTLHWGLDWWVGIGTGTSWSEGKTITDYVTYTVSSDTHTVTLSNSAAFGRPIKLSCYSDEDPSIGGSVRLDYERRLKSAKLFLTSKSLKGAGIAGGREVTFNDGEEYVIAGDSCTFSSVYTTSPNGKPTMTATFDFTPPLKQALATAFQENNIDFRFFPYRITYDAITLVDRSKVTFFQFNNAFLSNLVKYATGGDSCFLAALKEATKATGNYNYTPMSGIIVTFKLTYGSNSVTQKWENPGVLPTNTSIYSNSIIHFNANNW